MTVLLDDASKFMAKVVDPPLHNIQVICKNTSISVTFLVPQAVSHVNSSAIPVSGLWEYIIIKNIVSYIYYHNFVRY